MLLNLNESSGHAHVIPFSLWYFYNSNTKYYPMKPQNEEESDNSDLGLCRNSFKQK